MAVIPINLTIAGDTIAAVAVTSLTRSDTGLDAGVSLPIALTLANGAWVGSFTDANPPPYYNTILSITYSDSTVQMSPAFALQSGSTTAGIYGDITDIQAEMGEFNTAQSADPDNQENASTIAMHEQKAIAFADSYINATLAKGSFLTPATVNLGLLRIIFGKLGAYQLYQVRGLRDKKNAFQGKFDWAKRELRSLINSSKVNQGSASSFVLATGETNATPQGVGPANPLGLPNARWWNWPGW